MIEALTDPIAMSLPVRPGQIDQAALTGESLPVKKFTGDVAFSGSTIKQGERHALVYATGGPLSTGCQPALADSPASDFTPRV